jgi:hypothetical protein
LEQKETIKMVVNELFIPIGMGLNPCLWEYNIWLKTISIVFSIE